jgi:hypothetical protein
MLWTASSLKLSSYICPGQHCAPGEITMLFSIKVLYLTIDGTTINLYPLKTEIYNLIQNIRDIANKNKNKGVHFDVESLLSDTDYLNLTGIDRDSFDDVCGHVKEVREIRVRSIRTCIGILLTKLRSGCLTLYCQQCST